MSSTRPRSSTVRAVEHLDIALGFLGFWAVVLVVVVIWEQLSGQNAAGWALLLAALTVLVWLMLRLRRRLHGSTGRE